MCFALDRLTSGRIYGIRDAEYISSLEWYHTLPEISSGEADEDGIPASGEGHLNFLHWIARRSHEDVQFPNLCRYL